MNIQTTVTSFAKYSLPMLIASVMLMGSLKGEIAAATDFGSPSQQTGGAPSNDGDEMTQPTTEPQGQSTTPTTAPTSAPQQSTPTSQPTSDAPQESRACRVARRRLELCRESESAGRRSDCEFEEGEVALLCDKRRNPDRAMIEGLEGLASTGFAACDAEEGAPAHGLPRSCADAPTRRAA